MQRVLVLCTGNSCRSQMAEAAWELIGSGQWKAASAGSRPSVFVVVEADVKDELYAKSGCCGPELVQPEIRQQ